MCKKLLMLLMLFVSLTFVSSASAANMYWIGYDTNWLDATNWGGTGACPTYNDWVDIRRDSWVANFPVITTGQTALAGTIRINPGYGGARTAKITVDGGDLNVAQSIYVGWDTTNGADLILNSGSITTGIGGTNNFTMVGSNGGYGELHVNGGTLNTGVLGVPKWWETPGAGNVYIDGGLISTVGWLDPDVEDWYHGLVLGATGTVEFTKNLADDGGKIRYVADLSEADWDAWQTQLNGWVSSGQIFSSAGEIQVDYSSAGDTRTTEIYSVIPEPMTVALLGIGGLLLRRRRK